MNNIFKCQNNSRCSQVTKDNTTRYRISGVN